MTLLLAALVLLGAAALIVHLTRSLLRLGLALADAAAAASAAEIGARRGDLTALADGRRDEQAARRRALRRAFLVVLWLVALLLPPLVGWTRDAYAAASVLWLLSRVRTGGRRSPPVA
jgi:hypothetical protein